MDSYNIVEFNHGYDDSELEIEYTYTETDSSCFYLKALVTFYFKIWLQAFNFGFRPIANS